MIAELKRRIREIWPADEIILHATHTHSGPQVWDGFSRYGGAFDPLYVEELSVKVTEGIDVAIRNMEGVYAEHGLGECEIAMNRRQRAEGQVQIGMNPTGPADRELTVIRYRNYAGRVKGVLVHYACHPVVTMENSVSSEFTGVAMETLEQAIGGGGAVCAYLQGTCGDINPCERGGGDATVVKLGRQLASDVQRVLDAPMKRLSASALLSRAWQIELPLQAMPERAYLESLQSNPGAMGEWSGKLLAGFDSLKNYLPLSVTTLRLAEGIALLAMNAEVVTEYGLFLKSLSEGRVLPLGYCDGMIGYITTAQQLVEGGYEPIGSTIYFGMPAPFHSTAEQTLRDAMLRMVNDIYVPDTNTGS